jgi:hypothetical protein
MGMGMGQGFAGSRGVFAGRTVMRLNDNCPSNFTEKQKRKSLLPNCKFTHTLL